MTTNSERSFALVKEALNRHGGVSLDAIFLESSLEEVNIDSLAIAEMMFEFEDNLGVRMSEESPIPKTVSDLVALIEPYITSTVEAKV
jgi:acyl carrier protein